MASAGVDWWVAALPTDEDAAYDKWHQFLRKHEDDRMVDIQFHIRETGEFGELLRTELIRR